MITAVAIVFSALVATLWASSCWLIYRKEKRIAKRVQDEAEYKRFFYE